MKKLTITTKLQETQNQIKLFESQNIELLCEIVCRLNVLVNFVRDDNGNSNELPPA